MIKKLNKNKKARTLVTFLCVLISALSQAYVIQVFIQPANLLSSGFTGVAILIEKITSTYFGFSFSTSLGMMYRLLFYAIKILALDLHFFHYYKYF